MKGLKNYFYGVAAGLMFSASGCHALPNEGLQKISSELDPSEIIVQNITPSEKLIRSEPCPPETIQISNTYQQTYEPIEVERPTQINLEDTLRLDLPTLMPSFGRGLSLDQVTINLHGEEPKFSITDDLDNLYNPYFDPYGTRRDLEYQQNSGKLGAREYRIILQSAREIVRQLAREGYTPFVYMNRGLIQVERLGGLFQDVYGGIESIWTIDLGNLEQDFTDPLAPLRQALRVEARPQRQESRVQFTGRLEPTLNGKRMGTGSGQDLLGLFQGEKEADLGFQFQIQIRW